MESGFDIDALNDSDGFDERLEGESMSEESRCAARDREFVVRAVRASALVALCLDVILGN